MKNAFWTVELPKLGHEYAAHTMTHKIDSEEVVELEMLSRWLNGVIVCWF